MKEQEKLKQLHNDLNHAHANNIKLNYNTDPVLILASINLIMFDKLNECVERINYLERQINEIQRY